MFKNASDISSPPLGYIPLEWPASLIQCFIKCCLKCIKLV